MAKSSKKSWIRRLSGPKTQPSLFHYVKETPESSVFKDIDWSFLRHPIRSFKEAWKAPRTKPSLFHFIEEEPKIPFSWKDFLSDLFTGFRNPLFIPSVFSDPQELVEARAQGRTRRMEALMFVVFMYVLVGVGLLWIANYGSDSSLQDENIVYINNPIYLPYEGDGLEGGGGGGGGKNEAAPPATGVMPETTRVQMMAPDPNNPQPLLPAEDLLAQVPSVQMPIDIPQDRSLPIGDISAPPNASMSSGSGSGGGIGTGRGTGVGSGTGAGVGPGSGGGMGGGRGGGIGSGEGPYVVGNGVTQPIPLVEVKPPYTEEGRKARTEGIVLLQCVVDENGNADRFKVVRGLGYGLDESAISTIANKWRFKPGTLKGTPVKVQILIEVSFRLF